MIMFSSFKYQFASGGRGIMSLALLVRLNSWTAAYLGIWSGCRADIPCPAGYTFFLRWLYILMTSRMDICRDTKAYPWGFWEISNSIWLTICEMVSFSKFIFNNLLLQKTAFLYGYLLKHGWQFIFRWYWHYWCN